MPPTRAEDADVDDANVVKDAHRIVASSSPCALGKQHRERSSSIEAAMRAALGSLQAAAMPSGLARSCGARSLVAAWVPAVMSEAASNARGLRAGWRGRTAWACALFASAPWTTDGYASRAHLAVDVCGTLAAVVDFAIRAFVAHAEGESLSLFWRACRATARVAMMIRACAASALWLDLHGVKRGMRGVFHRLEHAGAVNVAVCVSVAIVVLQPNVGAFRETGIRAIDALIGDETLRRIEHLIMAAVGTTLFNILFNVTRRRLLGRPLQGIIETLEYHATQVLRDLDFQSEELQALDISVLGYVLDKMSHIVKRHESENGGPALIEAILQDHEDVDGSTLEWLVSYENGRGRQSKRDDTPATNAHRVTTFKSVVSSFARRSGPAGPYLNVDLDLLNSWSFDVFDMEDKAMTPYIVRMFYELDLFDMVDVFKLRRFISEVEAVYNDNPYHCYRHAVDVTHTTYLYIQMIKEQVSMTQVEMFALLVSSLIHDMDHPGVTNAYLIATHDTLALTYNDKSVLENLHLSRFFTMCHENEDANILSTLDDDTYKEVREMIISCVLHTDMAHHFKLVSRMNEIITMSMKNDIISSPIGSPVKSRPVRTPPASPVKPQLVSPIKRMASMRDNRQQTSVNASFKTAEERQVMLNIILHCADISNALKPNNLYVKWASRVLEEFFNQGDRERAKGMPISPMMDRETTSHALSQINFMEFVIAPLYVAFSTIFPSTAELLARLMENREHYQKEYELELLTATREDGVDRSTEKDSLRIRFRTLIEKHALHRFVPDSNESSFMRDILALEPRS